MGAVKNDKDLLIYFSAVQDKMLDFYKKGKLVDVTWVVGSEEEEISAHSSVCALSNRLKELLLAHPRDKSKRIIRIPSSLTNSADELKSLLLLAYTGSFEGNRSITEYIELCERFDMPIGHAMCSCALRVLFIKALLQPSIDVEQQKALQQIFVFAFEETTSIEVRQTMLDMFRMHPLIFNTPLCLSRVPLDWILKVIEEKRLWMRSADGYVCFGRSYVAGVNQLLGDIFVINGAIPIPVVFKSEESMLAPLCLIDPDYRSFGYHSYAYDYNYSELRGTKHSFDNHPPNQWKVCALTGHISRSWDGRQVLAGLDITYENLITGKKEEVLQTIQVPEDDVITGVIVNSGWLIDKLVFTTLRGMHLDALGGSDGGSVTVIEPSTFWNDDKHGSPPLAFHGIEYVNIKSRGQTFINKVNFRFSGVDREAVLRLNEDEKEFVNEILRDRKILL
nr:BTB:POZ domain containing protein [Hymenolepis microstoma]